MRTLVVLAALLLSATATAKPASNAEMAGYCQHLLQGPESKDPERMLKMGLCLGFTNALVDATAEKSGGLYCMPEGVTVIQAVRIYVQWTENNPKLLHRPAVQGFLHSLVEAFPCAAPAPRLKTTEL